MSLDGGTPGEAGGTRETTAEETETTDPATRAYIHILRGLGLTHQDIADELGLATTSSVETTLTDARERIADGADPIDVWADVTAPLYDNDPEAGDDN